MDYKLTPLPKSELEILVTLPFSEFEPHIKKAASFLSEETEIEGFRKGKAPYGIVKNKFGENVIYERAAELAVRKTYPEVLQRLSADEQFGTKGFAPLGRPEVTIIKLAPGNELHYKVRTALLPEVKLPDYKTIAGRRRQEKKMVSVNDEEVERTLKWIRESRATGEGEARKVPELTDDFVKSLGDFSSVEALKSSVHKGLQSEKEEREKERIRIGILEEIAKNSGIEVPDVLVESELEKMLAELKSGVEGMGMKWEDYLIHIKRTPEELRSGWNEDASKRVRAGLVLREIARAEKIEPTAEDIEARSGELLRQYSTPEEAGKNIDPEELREYTRGVLRNEKVFQYLESL